MAFNHPLTSKSNFAIAIRNQRPCLLGESKQGIRDAEILYGEALDAVVFDHYAAKKIAVLVHDVVQNPWGHKLKWHQKLRLVLVAILLPWFGSHCSAMGRLADEYDRTLKPLLK